MQAPAQTYAGTTQQLREISNDTQEDARPSVLVIKGASSVAVRNGSNCYLADTAAAAGAMASVAIATEDAKSEAAQQQTTSQLTLPVSTKTTFRLEDIDSDLCSSGAFGSNVATGSRNSSSSGTSHRSISQLEAPISYQLCSTSTPRQQSDVYQECYSWNQQHINYEQLMQQTCGATPSTPTIVALEVELMNRLCTEFRGTVGLWIEKEVPAASCCCVPWLVAGPR